MTELSLVADASDVIKIYNGFYYYRCIINISNLVEHDLLKISIPNPASNWIVCYVGRDEEHQPYERLLSYDKTNKYYVPAQLDQRYSIIPYLSDLPYITLILKTNSESVAYATINIQILRLNNSSPTNSASYSTKNWTEVLPTVVAPFDGFHISSNLSLSQVFNYGMAKLRKYPHVAMTSATSNGYTASYSSAYHSNWLPWKAFNGKIGNEGYWSGKQYNSDGSYSGSTKLQDINGTSHNGVWLKLQLPTPRKFIYCLIFPRTDPTNTDLINRAPRSGVILASNDNSSWILLSEFSGKTYTNYTGTKINIDSPYSFIYYVIVTKTILSSSTYLNISEIEYYGIDESENIASANYIQGDNSFKNIHNHIVPTPGTNNFSLETIFKNISNLSNKYIQQRRTKVESTIQTTITRWSDLTDEIPVYFYFYINDNITTNDEAAIIIQAGTASKAVIIIVGPDVLISSSNFDYAIEANMKTYIFNDTTSEIGPVKVTNVIRHPTSFLTSANSYNYTVGASNSRSNFEPYRAFDGSYQNTSETSWLSNSYNNTNVRYKAIPYAVHNRVSFYKNSNSGNMDSGTFYYNHSDYGPNYNPGPGYLKYILGPEDTEEYIFLGTKTTYNSAPLGITLTNEDWEGKKFDLYLRRNAVSEIYGNTYYYSLYYMLVNYQYDTVKDTNEWISLQFPRQVKLSGMYILLNSEFLNNKPIDITIWAKNDTSSTTWVQLNTSTQDSNFIAYEPNFHYIFAYSQYLIYKLTFNQISGDFLKIAEIFFFEEPEDSECFIHNLSSESTLSTNYLWIPKVYTIYSEKTIEYTVLNDAENLNILSAVSSKIESDKEQINIYLYPTDDTTEIISTDASNGALIIDLNGYTNIKLLNIHVYVLITGKHGVPGTAGNASGYNGGNGADGGDGGVAIQVINNDNNAQVNIFDINNKVIGGFGASGGNGGQAGRPHIDATKYTEHTQGNGTTTTYGNSPHLVDGLYYYVKSDTGSVVLKFGGKEYTMVNTNSIYEDPYHILGSYNSPDYYTTPAGTKLENTQHSGKPIQIRVIPGDLKVDNLYYIKFRKIHYQFAKGDLKTAEQSVITAGNGTQGTAATAREHNANNIFTPIDGNAGNTATGRNVGSAGNAGTKGANGKKFNEGELYYSN